MKMMGTEDVRVDTRLNKHIWSRGVRSVSICAAADADSSRQPVRWLDISLKDSVPLLCFDSLFSGVQLVENEHTVLTQDPENCPF